MLPDSQNLHGEKRKETPAIPNEIILYLRQFFKLWDYSGRTDGNQEKCQVANWNLFMSVGKITVLKQRENKPYHF